jgi:hypothetical protein
MKVDSTSTLLNEGYQSGNIQFINNLTGYYSQISFPWVGRSGNVLKTTNGGLNWYTLSNTIYSSMLFGSGLRCLQFVNENTGYVVGEYGVILKTTNGGGNLYIGINESSKEIPKSSSLYQNYPNPFNPTTKIRFDIPNDLSVNYKKGLTSFSGA